MLAIKFKRVGKKHQASFRIVVTEKRSKLNGRFVDDLGWFDPRTDKFELDKERAGHWLKTGAQATPSVHNLFVKAGIAEGPKIPVHKKPKKNVSGETEKAAETAPATAGAEKPSA